MQTYSKTRIDIVLEQAAVPRLTKILDDQLGVGGYAVVAVQAGRGEHGVWSRDGQISSAGDMMMVMCIVDTQAKDAMLDKIFPYIEKRAGFVTISEVEVVRAERF